MKKIKKYKDQKYCGRDSVLVCLDCHSKIPLPRWASGPITSWETDRETVETVSDFILGCSKITADGDCSHEIKRCLLPGRKVMNNLGGIFKSRDITFPTKVCLVKVWFFLWSCMDVRVGL